MAFARGVDHLDGDQLSIQEFVVPHPNSSVLFRVKDDRMAADAILRGDLAVIDRTPRLQEGRIALVSVAGEARLVRVRREGTRFTFDELPAEDTTVELLGIASRIVRPLIP
ncbi:MAG TPA: S24 family peptidase [Thermoanaerobaculia bacterium]|nr:S24 family peptidase [Thermoanaerobaculia bacterium]